MAAQATSKAQGVLVQGWATGKGALWSYQGAPTTLQVATGVAVGPYGFVYGVGYYLEVNNVLASGVVQLNPV